MKKENSIVFGRKLRHRICAFFLCFVFLFGAIPVGGYEVKAELLTDILSTVELYKDGAKLESGGCQISLGDTLEIRYNLVNLITDYQYNPDGCNVPKNGSFTFVVPKGIKIAAGAETEWDVDYKDNLGNLKPLGKATYSKPEGSETGSITFVLADDEALYNGSVSEILGAYIAFGGQLDEEALNDSPDQTIDFAATNLGPFSFVYGDKLPVDTTITNKEVSYSENKAHWKVTLTEGNQTYESGLEFVDVLTANQDFDPSSFKMDGTDISASVSIEENALTGEETARYLYTPAVAPVKGTVHEITYDTNFNQRAYVESSGQVVTSGSFNGSNTASLYNKSTEQLINSATQNVSNGASGAISWQDKSSSNRLVGDEQITTWTVTVNTQGFAFDNLILTDSAKSKPSNEESKFIFDTNSVKVQNTGYPGSAYSGLTSVPLGMDGGEGEAKITTGSMVGAEGYADGNGNFVWQLQLDGDGANGTYTITYETRITNYSKYRLHNQNPTENSVSLAFDWPDYYGPGVDRHVGVPAVTKKVEGITGNAMIKKSAGIYNPSNHTIKWHISVNTDKVDSGMDNMSVLDTINGLEGSRKTGDLLQSMTAAVPTDGILIDGALANEEQLAYIRTANNTEEGTIEISFNNSGSHPGENLLNGHKIEFDVVTSLDAGEADYYENHISSSKGNIRIARNSVSLMESGTALTNANAACSPEIKMLNKEALSYDYTNRKASWRITVNESSVDNLSQVYVEDTIETGTLDMENVKVSVEDGPQITLDQDSSKAQYFTYNEATGKFLVYLKSTEGTVVVDKLSQKCVVTYNTVLSDDSTINTQGAVLAKYSGSFSLKNTAKLHKGSSTTVPEMTVTKDIENKQLSKVYSDSGEKDVVKYTISLNQQQAVWKSGQTIVDIMAPGLELNLASLKLSEAEVRSDGSFHETEKTVAKSDYTRTVSFLEEGNPEGLPVGSTKLVLTLPADAGNKAYIISYLAALKDGATQSSFSNKASAVGFITDGSFEGEDIQADTLHGYGGGHAIAKSRITVNKKNKDNGQVLSRAAFALKYEGQVVATTETGTNGQCIFSDLVAGETYEVEEIAAPNGYLMGTGTNLKQTFVAPPRGDLSMMGTNGLVFQDEREAFHINIKDDAGNGIQDVKVGIFDVSETEFTEANAKEVAVSDANGAAAFSFTDEGKWKIVQISVPEKYIPAQTVLICQIDDNGAVSKIHNQDDESEARQNFIVNERINKTDEPTDKPTDEPTDKPTDKPSDKPTDKPADQQPTEKPTDKPADNQNDQGNQNNGDNGNQNGGANGQGSTVTTLPKTGREQRTGFFLAGGLLIVAGAAVYYKKGRKKHVEK